VTISPIIALVVIFSTYLRPASTYSKFLDEVCSLPLSEGKDCAIDNHQPKFQYYFDSKEEVCAPFLFNGCGGNNNRFALQDDCTDSCQVEWLLRKQNKPSNDTQTYENCKLPKRAGPCKAMIRQYYFDQQADECLEFMYGGCKGNKNRFNSKGQCQVICEKKDNTKSKG